ncbi:hypothetical protein [Burkholderia sp. FL-7-2-10-S1-D7]|uniref:hypothetical protein n=1 Tax=Burkholderia sp. FL-7-2-10-S1-D7 TaxID=1637866 RepID=UPI000B30A455|nr:hypothetical protein [Burkholderia sp. FL-7-2-10-S1-D7]
MKLATRFVQHVSQRHVDKGQVSGEVSAFIVWQRGKQLIFGNGRVVLHAWLLRSRAADDGASGRYGRSGNGRDGQSSYFTDPTTGQGGGDNASFFDEFGMTVRMRIYLQEL